MVGDLDKMIPPVNLRTARVWLLATHTLALTALRRSRTIRLTAIPFCLALNRVMQVLQVDQLRGAPTPIAELRVILTGTIPFVNSPIVLLNFAWAIKRVHHRNNGAARSEVPES